MMQYIQQAVVLGYIVFLFVTLTSVAQANTVPNTYTNNNFWTSYHVAPESFYMTKEREIFGTTTTGITFRQLNVVNDYDIRLQRFEIQQAYFYVSDRGVIVAETDTQALSQYMARG